MFEIDHIDPHGMTERWPAGRVYAEALANHAGYVGGTETAPKKWYWTSRGTRSDLYTPGCIGTVVLARFYEPRRMLGLYLMEPNADNILCRMLGEPWDDGTLFGIIASIRHMPYARLVTQAMIDQADWLDAHPQYRGLRIAQTRSRRRPQPAQLEIGP
jgi:hypothetical protein